MTRGAPIPQTATRHALFRTATRGGRKKFQPGKTPLSRVSKCKNIPTHKPLGMQKGTVSMSRKEKVDPDKLHADRVEAGKRINPENSFMFCRHTMVVDPYGILDDISPEYQCIGKTWFVSSPDEGVVYVGDVPEEILERLEQHSRTAKDRSLDDIEF